MPRIWQWKAGEVGVSEAAHRHGVHRSLSSKALPLPAPTVTSPGNLLRAVTGVMWLPPPVTAEVEKQGRQGGCVTNEKKGRNTEVKQHAGASGLSLKVRPASSARTAVGCGVEISSGARFDSRTFAGVPTGPPPLAGAAAVSPSGVGGGETSRTRSTGQFCRINCVTAFCLSWTRRRQRQRRCV